MSKELEKLQGEVDKLRQDVERLTNFIIERVETPSSSCKGENGSEGDEGDKYFKLRIRKKQEEEFEVLRKIMQEQGVDKESIEDKIDSFKKYAEGITELSTPQEIALKEDCDKALRTWAENQEEGMAIHVGLVSKSAKEVSLSGLCDTKKRFLKADEQITADFFSLFSSRQRVALLKSLIGGEKTATQLQEKSGLSGGGQFYHHLKELAAAGLLIKKERGVYGLSSTGRMFVPVILSIGWNLREMQVSKLSDLINMAGGETLLNPDDLDVLA